MTTKHLYYLHTNGDLIHKPDTDTQAADIRESDFAVGLWFINTMNRADAWQLLVEALAAGANKDRVFSLATKWNCTNEDAQNYAQYAGFNLEKDGSDYCATPKWHVDLMTSPAGFGPTALDAIAALAKELGYKPSKMWGTSFAYLLEEKNPDNQQFGAGA